MALSNSQKKHFRAIGHKLHPVVSIAGKGLSEGVMEELERALEDHELIKIKVSLGDRDDKKNLMAQICLRCNAELVQTIGHTGLIFRPAKTPDPKLSNLLRSL